MLKLLVADDERILREAVCYLIDWKSIGIELAASCKNGREAYEEACRTKPDIILTDINNGSVHHQMMQLCLCPNVYVQTGMCLSMVLEILLASPQAGIEETVKHAVESTKENMLGFNFRSIREMKEDELW